MASLKICPICHKNFTAHYGINLVILGPYCSRECLNRDIASRDVKKRRAG